MSDALRAGAAAVLQHNDQGGWTRPSPRLYPHQWSWDAAMCAIGWATIDPDRALAELEHLFDAQWADGRLPHIVYDPAAADAYFPGPDQWHIAGAKGGPPTDVATSGLVQPPLHAIALRRVWTRIVAASTDADERADLASRTAALWPRVADWHGYLRRERDPFDTGLVTIWHPWESGLDNSPRWDGALARVTIGDLEPYARVDGSVVGTGQRPTDHDYDRYVWLMQEAARVGWVDAALAEHHPFCTTDVLASALLAAADDALASLALDLTDQGCAVADDEQLTALHVDADRTRAALDAAWDESTGLCLDRDLRHGEPLVARTIAGFAPLIAGGLRDWSRELLPRLDSTAFCGGTRFIQPTPPTTATDDEAFDPHNYWRGPTWPVITWLLWWALRRAGHHERAARLRIAGLAQLERRQFPEYLDPLTGEALGSDSQSWTAAAALDWLAPPV